MDRRMPLNFCFSALEVRKDNPQPAREPGR